MRKIRREREEYYGRGGFFFNESEADDGSRSLVGSERGIGVCGCYYRDSDSYGEGYCGC